MHNNYYFLRKLCQQLEQELKGAVISECFSQNKDELILRFETATIPFFIKASLSPAISALSFPKEFHRARKNSVDLFETLIGRRVKEVQQFDNERSFAFLLSDEITLLFKMHGNKSNILVFEHSREPLLFKNALAGDRVVELEGLNRVIDWSFEAFLANSNNLSNLYFTFGKVVWRYFATSNFETLSKEEHWNKIIEMRDALEQADKFYITDFNGKVALSLLKFGDIKKEYSNPIQAANEFFYFTTKASSSDDNKQKVISELSSRLQSTKNYIAKTSEKLAEVENNNNYKIWADLIMANMHAIPQGASKVTVENFYNDNKTLEIKLRKDQTPQRNAETFYRKSKNQQIEIDKLRETIANKEALATSLKAKLQQIHEGASPTEIDEYLKENSLRASEKEAGPLPYHEFIFNGYKIWVGRNAESNDILTLKLSYKEDLWLHAKDVSGSHVLIKHQAGKVFPKDVIERAAELAAYNSKRKNDSLCPVTLTPKKFVRKRKGDPAGAVVVEREDVIMVVPRL